ncbi:M48 family metalloprotease [Candidatus Entotheonella palauensis]|uniref:M48 family metalloprotease n=1 Tax=Candidatus Entotheonella palauensis TaxID=93172 RepID=UPI0015C45CE4|nr:M48 family metalloprotease [Candidatus Entotheonella palauensis]
MNQETHKRERQAFPNMSSQTWTHPADQAALTALKTIPGVDVLLQKFIGATSETSIRLIHLASAVRASHRQFPQLHSLLKEACRILDAPQVPELYVAQNPFFNAGTIGVERPFIVLNSAVLDTLTEDEILCVIGHELGHCLSGHALYKTLLQVLLKFMFLALQVPLGATALMGIIAALMEWNRKSELSADRAGLLVVQDPTVSYSLLMKLAGGMQANRMDVNEFFVQAAEYEGGGNIFTSLHKLLNVILASHPFPVVRLTELQTWVNSGTYSSILSQNYRTRADEKKSEDDILKNFKAASESYQEHFDNSKDALAGVMSDVFAGLESWSEQARQGMESFFDFAKKADSSQTPPATEPAESSSHAAAHTAADTPQATATATEQDIFAALERLGDLKQKGVLTDEEFEAQKIKLLNRL